MNANTSAANQSLVISNNIVFNNLIQAVRSGKPVKCRISKTRSVTVQVLSTDDTDITEFDLAVLSCIHGIYQDTANPDNEFTITAVCRMLGCTDKGGVSPSMCKKIEESLKRLKNLQISITGVDNDFESHRKAFLNDHPDYSAHAGWDQMTGINWAMRNPLIQLKKRTIDRSGGKGTKKEVRYKIAAAPLLFVYSDITGQFVTIPADRFRIYDTDENGELTENRESMTRNRIAITFRLARQWQRVQYDHQHPRKKKPDSIYKLRLSTIVDRAGIDRRTASRHKGDHLAFIRKVLTCWKAMDVIADWEITESRIGRDAIIFHPEAKEASSQNAASDISGDAPNFDAIFGALDTIIGALDTIFGAINKPGFIVKRAIESGLQAVRKAVAELRKYPKYSTHDCPPALKAAGTVGSR